MKKILVILGPTSTGKTDLALRLAKKFNGELISCDSRQVYIGLDIGTGKLPSGRWKIEDGRCKKGKGWWEINKVKIWMYDVISFKKQYTVADYVKDARVVIEDIQARLKVPIIVGGSGLYLRVLLSGLASLSIPYDEKLRKELERLTVDELQNRLKKVSMNRWRIMNNSDQQNPRRLIRAIEIKILKARKIINLRQIQGKLPRSDILKIGLTAPRQLLYQKSDERVISRMKQGMVNETRFLRNKGLSLKRMKQLGLEYGILADFLEGKIKQEEELIHVLQSKIHGFIRRQLTWFKKEEEVRWFDVSKKDYQEQVENLVVGWYDSA